MKKFHLGLVVTKLFAAGSLGLLMMGMVNGQESNDELNILTDEMKMTEEQPYTDGPYRCINSLALGGEELLVNKQSIGSYTTNELVKKIQNQLNFFAYTKKGEVNVHGVYKNNDGKYYSILCRNINKSK